MKDVKQQSKEFLHPRMTFKNRLVQSIENS